MNRDWSEQNKWMQGLLKKAAFREAGHELLSLRAKLAEEALTWRDRLTDAEFSAMPYPNAEGYHNKTVAYSLWHIARIEDIVTHTLIQRDEQVFFSGGYREKTASPIITTGNELAGGEIAAFSKRLNIDALYDYFMAVRMSTDDLVKRMDGSELKNRFDESDKERLRRLNVVSGDEKAAWLIDYWCGKDVKGLIQMPMSRHWIMHIEAADRIIEKILKDR